MLLNLLTFKLVILHIEAPYVKEKSRNKLDSESIKIIEAKHHDPFSVLGRHPHDKLINVKVYLPYA